MTMETQKAIVVRTPPFLDDANEQILNQTIKELQETFPDRKIVKIPANVMVEFVS